MKRERKEKEKRDTEISGENQVNWYRINKLRGGSGTNCIFTCQEENEEK